MITATRRIQFSAGHRVSGHENKCANLHGHNFVVIAHAMRKSAFTSEEKDLDEIGRVIDFGVLKSKLWTWIMAEWDHRFLMWQEDVLMRTVFYAGGTSVGFDYGVIGVPFNPTAENIADHLLNVVCPKLFEKDAVMITRIEVWETENCRAIAHLSRQ